MTILIILTLCCLLLSLLFDRQKTMTGLQIGWKMFLNMLPALLTILSIVSILLYLVPQESIVQLLGAKSGPVGVLIAGLVGAIALIPPFIAFPLAGILLYKGVGYSVVAVFVTTLIMVGFVTIPIEIRYFGKKAALLRNSLSFVAALIIGLLIGLVL